MTFQGKEFSKVEFFMELSEIYAHAECEYGIAHIALCVERAERLSAIEPLGDPDRETVRVVAVALHDVRHALHLLAKYGVEQLVDAGDYKQLFAAMSADRHFEIIGAVLSKYTNAIAEALSTQGAPVSSLSKWVVSCTRWRYAYEMVGIARYHLAQSSDEKAIRQYIAARWVGPWCTRHGLPIKIADSLFRREVEQIEKAINSERAKSFCALLAVDDNKGRFNGTVSNYTAKFINQYCDLLTAVFGDFDLEECDGTGRHYYLCCTRTMFDYVCKVS